MATVCIRGGGAAARESSPDETLTRRIAAGDKSAMRALFARYRVRVYRWLLRLVDDEALAEDLLSEVFLDVWRYAASFEARSSLSTWLLADCTLQGALGASSSDRCRVGRGNRVYGAGHHGRS